MGFLIKEIIVHTAVTDKPGHYNSEPQTNWQTKDFLRVIFIFYLSFFSKYFIANK